MHGEEEGQEDKKKADGAIVVKGKFEIEPGKPAKVESSKLAFKGPLFNVYTDEVAEAGRPQGCGGDVILSTTGR